eukprot:7041901-Heterocapsa_arctica.AAC.1
MSFLKVAKVCHAHGANIAFEWPSGCEYWRWQKVKDFVNKYQLNKVRIHGCAVGLKTDEGIPMVKPWTFATDDSYVFQAFQDKKCPGPEAHP